jgi:Zn-dependent M32 family carboxypeptidase
VSSVGFLNSIKRAYYKLDIHTAPRGTLFYRAHRMVKAGYYLSQPSYNQDGLRSIHNHDFMSDPAFCTDADEVTYNLHIMLRFDLELELLEGHLRVKDLPEAWRARMRAELGLAPADDRDGCLQDVHWYGLSTVGGGFQSYTIGNILSAQFYAAAIKTHPDIPREIAKGEFDTLHGWLREHLYQHGRKFQRSEVIARATGGPLSTGPYLVYLRAKYGELYRLPTAGHG